MLCEVTNDLIICLLSQHPILCSTCPLPFSITYLQHEGIVHCGFFLGGGGGTVYVTLQCGGGGGGALLVVCLVAPPPPSPQQTPQGCSSCFRAAPQVQVARSQIVPPTPA